MCADGGSGLSLTRPVLPYQMQGTRDAVTLASYDPWLLN